MSPRLTPRGRLGAALLALSALLTAGASPASAQAPETPLRVVVTKTEDSRPSVASVINVRVKNTGTTTYDGPLTVTIRAEEGSPALSSVLRSFYGWNCLNYPYDYWSGRSLRLVPGDYYVCQLRSGIEAGSYSLPIEIEALPYYGDLNAGVQVDGEIPLVAAGRADPGPTSIPVPNANEAGELVKDITFLTWDNSSSVTEHPRGPKTTAAASPASVSGSDVATIGFGVTSSTNISTGPFSYLEQLLEGGFGSGRAWDSEGPFPTPQVVLTLPSNAVELVSLSGYQPVPEGGASMELPTSRASRTFDDVAHADEIPIPSSDIVSQGGGVYRVTLPNITRFLPDNPWRFIAKVRLKDGVNEATLSVDALAPDWAEEVPETGRAGRAVFTGDDSAVASVTIRRATPAPDAGGVLAQDVSPVLVGRARFAADAIRVGRTTKVNVTVTNNGNGASVAGRVCVRFTSHLVIVKKPKGVTQKGLLLCAPTPAIAVGQTITAAKGIVVRGVRTTDEARVRDGANDGVAVTGDVLEIFGQQLRAGGVTG